MQRDDLVRIGKRFITEFQRDDVPGLAAELAYRFLFAIFPFGIFVAALTAFIAKAIGFADPTREIMGSLSDNLPADIAKVVQPQLEAVLGQTQPGLLTFGAVAALWAATGGMNALMKATNKAWEVEETRSFLPKTALAIGLTVLGGVGVIASFVTIVGASLLTQQVADQIGLGSTAQQVVSVLRWPAVFALLSIAVGMLYHWAPNFRAPWRWCLAGGALFAVTWTLATWLFSLYVANFANYANTYGALGGVIVLMLWFYLSGILIVSAAAVMAAALKELQPNLVHERRVERGSRAEGTKGAIAPTGEPVPQPASAEPAGPARPADPADPGRVRPERARPERPTRPIRRLKPATYRMSGPEDWAVAGIVTAAGLSAGAVIAWLLGPHPRRS